MFNEDFHRSAFEFTTVDILQPVSRGTVFLKKIIYLLSQVTAVTVVIFY